MSTWNKVHTQRVMLIIGEPDGFVLPLARRTSPDGWWTEIKVGHLNGSTEIVRASDLVALSIVSSDPTVVQEARQRLYIMHVYDADESDDR